MELKPIGTTPHYHARPSLNLPQSEVKERNVKAKRQENEILDFVKIQTDNIVNYSFTSENLMNSNVLPKATRITSYRRALTNLCDANFIERCGGLIGSQNHMITVYRLKVNAGQKDMFYVKKLKPMQKVKAYQSIIDRLRKSIALPNWAIDELNELK